MLWLGKKNTISAGYDRHSALKAAACRQPLL
jgi:hypothetical protein